MLRNYWGCSTMDKKELERRLDRLCSTLTRCKEPKCFTCGKRLRYADRQAGHFIPRVVKWTRWDLDNIHTQCYECNVQKGGNLSRYREKLPIPTRMTLDALYDAYKRGQLPEPDEVHRITLYNQLLTTIRDSYPLRAQPFCEWQKIE